MPFTQRKRTFDDLSKHLTRTNTCKHVATLLFRQQSYNHFEVLKAHFHCHSYFCEKCAKIKRNRLVKKLQDLSPRGRMVFFTLTLDTKLWTPEESIKQISERFNMFCKLMRYRRFKFQFFKIIEFTKVGVAHLHVLADAFLPQPIISKVWYSLTGSPVAHIKEIVNKQMAMYYILKYMAKSVNGLNNYIFYLFCKRRYSYSLRFFLPKSWEQKFNRTFHYFEKDFDLVEVANKYFRLHFSNFPLIEFHYLN